MGKLAPGRYTAPSGYKSVAITKSTGKIRALVEDRLERDRIRRIAAYYTMMELRKIRALEQLEELEC